MRRQRQGIRLASVDRQTGNIPDKVAAFPWITNLPARDPDLVPRPENSAVMTMVLRKILGKDMMIEGPDRVQVVTPMMFALSRSGGPLIGQNRLPGFGDPDSLIRLFHFER